MAFDLSQYLQPSQLRRTLSVQIRPYIRIQRFYDEVKLLKQTMQLKYQRKIICFLEKKYTKFFGGAEARKPSCKRLLTFAGWKGILFNGLHMFQFGRVKRRDLRQIRFFSHISERNSEIIFYTAVQKSFASWLARENGDRPQILIPCPNKAWRDKVVFLTKNCFTLFYLFCFVFIFTFFMFQTTTRNSEIFNFYFDPFERLSLEHTKLIAGEAIFDIL